MDKHSRLSLLRERAKARPALSPVAADILEAVRNEDPDLGSTDAAGVLAPDEIERAERFETEDENEANLSELSPSMRENARFAERERDSALAYRE